MKITLDLSAGLWTRLRAHLLPGGVREEQAAFLFACPTSSADELCLRATEAYMLSPSDFDAQHADYFEVTDECRARLIREAHQKQTSLVELHSHPGPWAAEFSTYDLRGFEETVPHMRWRLKNRPYAAIVVAQSGFDALVWVDKDQTSRTLSAIYADGHALIPTKLTLRRQ